MALALTEPAAVGDLLSMVTSHEEKLIIMYQMTKNTGFETVYLVHTDRHSQNIRAAAMYFLDSRATMICERVNEMLEIKLASQILDNKYAVYYYPEST